MNATELGFVLVTGASRGIGRTVAAKERQLYGPMFQNLEKLLPSLDAHAPSPEPVAEVVLEALTVEHPQTRYLVGEDTAQYADLAVQPDRARDAAFAEMFGAD